MAYLSGLYRGFLIMLLATLLFALSACGDSTRAQSNSDGNPSTRSENVLGNWERATVWQAGTRITSWNAPGNRDTSSLVLEIVFGLPDRAVDLESLTEGLVANLGLEIGETLPVAPLPGVYQKAFMANEPGKPLHQVNIIALRELGQQRVLMFAALPEAHGQLGGRDLLLTQFLNGKPLSAVARNVDAAEALLTRVDADSVMTRADSGEGLSHGQFAMIVETVELLSGVRLTVTDIEALRTDVIKDWNKEPDASEFATLRTFLDQVKAAEQHKQLEFAAKLYASAYLEEKQKGEHTALMRRVLNLNPVRAETRGQILTTRALEARLRSLVIVLELQGNSALSIERKLEKAEKTLIKDFGKMPIKSREALMLAESRGLRLLGTFMNLTSGQKQEQLRQASISSGGSMSALLLAEHLEQKAISSSSLPAWLEQMILTPSLLVDLQSARPN